MLGIDFGWDEGGRCDECIHPFDSSDSLAQDFPNRRKDVLIPAQNHKFRVTAIPPEVLLAHFRVVGLSAPNRCASPPRLPGDLR